MERLLELARLRFSSEELKIVCRDVERIAKYLSGVSEIIGDTTVEPLFHVWEEESRLLENSQDRSIDIEDLPVEVENGYVKVPWRGGVK